MSNPNQENCIISITSKDMAAAMGKTLWTTQWFIPAYRTGEIGEWKINPGGQLVTDWGYVSGPSMLEMLPSLLRRRRTGSGAESTWDTWMSLTPHEIESQELGCQYARGHTVVMGLGMGWVAANMAFNPDVSRVTIIELDPSVIDLNHQCGALESLPVPIREKIRIVHANALEWTPQPDEPVDFLYADIWLGLAEPETLSQVRMMQENVKAEVLYYWGQEIAIYAACQKCICEESPLTDRIIAKAMEEVIDLPLLIPGEINYPQMIETVIANRRQRGLTIQVEV